MPVSPDRDRPLAAVGDEGASAPGGIAGLGSFTRSRVERIVGIVIAVGCIALGAQGFVAALNPAGERPGWYPLLQLIVFVPLAAMLLACFAGRGQRLFAAVFTAAFVVALVLWPIAAADLPASPDVEPWIFFLLNVGAAAAVIAFSLVLQIVVAVGISALWGVVRLVQAGFAPAFTIPVILDVSFALIFGGIVVTLAWMFRGAATRVDAARAVAVASYAASAAAEATEKERVAVGALMHDSVLAALIAVERADSPRERTLAAGMARDALTRLANTERDAGMGPEAPVDVATIARAVENAAAELGHTLRVEHSQRSSARVPGVVARAVELAATQAIANAIQHADAVGLRASVASAPDPVRITVRVRDTGTGFDPAAVPADRLGISASIVARMAAVGGRARIESGPAGTDVTLEWAEGA